MFRALLACLFLTACSGQPSAPPPKYISIVVLETNCHEFDGAILVRSNGTIKVEHDIELADTAAKDIPIPQGIKVVDGPCRASSRGPNPQQGTL